MVGQKIVTVGHVKFQRVEFVGVGRHGKAFVRVGNNGADAQGAELIDQRCQDTRIERFFQHGAHVSEIALAQLGDRQQALQQWPVVARSPLHGRKRVGDPHR